MNTNLKLIGEPEPIKELENIRKEYKDNWITDLKDDIIYYIINLPKFFIYRLPNYFRNLIHYTPFLYKLGHFDYGYILQFESMYLKRMLKRYEKYNMYVGQEDIGRYIKLMIRLIDLMDEPSGSYKVNVANSSRFLNKKFIDLIKNKEGEDYTDDWSFKVELRDAKIWHLYCKVRDEKLRSMWD